MSAETTSAAAALAGALIGASAIMIGQWRTANYERQRMRHETRGRVNALSASIFRDFLAACKAVEQLAERREDGESVESHELAAAKSRMWLTAQEVEAFCPSDLAEHATNFASALVHAAHETPEPNVVSYLTEPRSALLRAANPSFREADLPGQ